MVNNNNCVKYLIDYENYELDDAKVFELFDYLTDNKMTGVLQGTYGRQWSEIKARKELL